jgi:hypothetical protein
MKLYGEFGEDGLETTKVGRPKSMSVPKNKKIQNITFFITL